MIIKENKLFKKHSKNIDLFEKYSKIIFEDPFSIKDISSDYEMYSTLCFLALHKNGLTIKNIKNPTADMAIIAIKQNKESFFLMNKDLQFELLDLMIEPTDS